MSGNQVFAEEHSLEYSDYDIHDFVFPSSFLEMFQDIAGNHSERLGCGYETMKAKDLMWILARNRLDILGNPKVAEKLKVTTIVKRPIGLQFERELAIEGTKSGELYVTGLSVWVVSNLKTRRLVRPAGIAYPDSFPYKETRYQKGLLALPELDNGGMKPYEYKVGFSDLDHNRHMNNCRYATALLDAISPKEGQRLSFLEIDYEKEVLEGDTLSIFLGKQDDGSYLAKALRSDGKVSFKASFGLTQDRG